MSAFMGNRKTYARTEFFSVEPMLRVEGARSREDRGRRRRPRRGRSETYGAQTWSRWTGAAGAIVSTLIDRTDEGCWLSRTSPGGSQVVITAGQGRGGKRPGTAAVRCCGADLPIS